MRDWISGTGLSVDEGVESNYDWLVNGTVNGTYNQDMSSWEFRDTGEWTVARSKTNETAGAPTLGFTLCYTQPETGDYVISVTSNVDGHEPNLQQRSDQKFDTTDIQFQLDATNPSSISRERRSIFELPPPKEWEKLTGNASTGDTQYAKDLTYFLPVFTDAEETSRNGALLTSEDTGKNKGSYVINPVHVALFQGIIQSTANPALALQALITTITSMNYYDCAYAFTNTAPATMYSTTEALAPVRWTGFLGVVAIISVHFCLMAVFLFHFSRNTEHSMIGRPWQAVAQVVSEDTAGAVEASTVLTDKEVRAWAQMNGGEARFRLVGGDERGRSELRAT